MRSGCNATTVNKIDEWNIYYGIKSGSQKPQKCNVSNHGIAHRCVYSNIHTKVQLVTRISGHQMVLFLNILVWPTMYQWATTLPCNLSGVTVHRRVTHVWDHRQQLQQLGVASEDCFKNDTDRRRNEKVTYTVSIIHPGCLSILIFKSDTEDSSTKKIIVNQRWFQAVL